MNRKNLSVWALLSLIFPAASWADSAHDVAMRMIEAHGGMDRWVDAPSVSYEHTLIAPGHEDDPWVAREVIEQGRRRVVQDWPLDEATLVNDGTDVWTKGWKRDNPPKFMVYVSYYIMNLPWITQDPGIVLDEPGRGTLPTGDKEYITLRMTYEPEVASSEHDYYTLYIDPETYRMKGVEFVVTYGALLDLMGMPEEMEFMGPMFKIFEETATVDGLLVPLRYTTYSPQGDVYGNHEVKEWSFRKPFDENRLKRPADAVVDRSSAKRGHSTG